MNMSFIVAVDIGGTQIRAAAYEPNSITPFAQKRTRTRASEPGVFDRLVQTIEAVWQPGEVDAIGIASPGPLDPHTGTILDTPNIKEWVNFPVGPRLCDTFGVPVYLDNDANMAGLAEWQYGAGRGVNDIVYLTVSTGIGGGVISNGELMQGSRGMAAELGHIIVDPNGPLCGCGQRGHVEAFSSGPALARYVAEQIKAGKETSLQASPRPTAVQVAEAAQQGDALAISAFERAGYYLGIAVANYLAIFDPSMVIFGGGASQAGDLLFKPFRESLKKHTFHPHYLDDLTITKAALGDDAGLLGALALASLAVERDERLKSR
jgi:glucokinase